MVRARSLSSSLASLIALMALGSGCDRDKPTATTTSAAEPTGMTPKTTGSAMPPSETKQPGSAASASPTGVSTKKKEPIVTFKGVGLAVPESIIHDAAADVYLVSNVGGQPTAVDGNGFISRLSPDGKVETLKWIEGGKNKVTLNAPKGLGLMGDSLYVADIDTVRIFNRKTGAPEGEVKIPGATFLADLAVTTDGHILVSDMGMKAGAKGFDPTGSDAVWSIDKAKKVTPLAKSKDLNGPNGILPGTDKTWVVTFRGNEMYSLDSKGKKGEVKTMPMGTLDGIVMLPSGDVLVSSWEANTVYRGRPGGDFAPMVEDVKSPADIGYDNRRNRLLVPLFESDEVRVYDIPR
jgi:hypothetical protein